MNTKTSIHSLGDLLLPQDHQAISAVRDTLPFKITRDFAGLINWSNSQDPLRKQVVPSMQEMHTASNESRDPLAESTFEVIPGLIHKYTGRALWCISNVCAIHCRFCFRRWRYHHLAIRHPVDTAFRFEPVFDYIRNHPDITEIILSGGDPLSMDRSLLNECLERLDSIPSIRLIRIHTRSPVVAWNEELSKPQFYLTTRATTRIVFHINHPAELSTGFLGFADVMATNRIPMLSQTVLLAGVNDSEKTLSDLFCGLISVRIHPYYIHALDPAEGTSHFGVPDETAIKLIEGIRRKLPGYAVPRLVRDVPGRGSKTILA